VGGALELDGLGGAAVFILSFLIKPKEHLQAPPNDARSLGTHIQIRLSVQWGEILEGRVEC